MTRITDEAVEAGARAIAGHRYDDLTDRSKEAFRDETRAALAAALPHLEGARPVDVALTMADRERIWEVIAEVRDTFPRLPNDAPTDDIIDALFTAGVFREGATPACVGCSVDPSPEQGIPDRFIPDGDCPIHGEGATPVAERAAIAVALHDADWHHQWGASNCEFFECQDVSLRRADVVLALIGGVS
jgi:hypothetical protein